MPYYLSRKVAWGFDEAVARVRDELKKEGFGVLTEIDVRATLKQKLDVDYPPYLILGACNPPFAYRALQAEPRIGILLPCNVVVQQLADGEVEVAAVDPVTAMASISNPALQTIATEIRDKLQQVLNGCG